MAPEEEKCKAVVQLALPHLALAEFVPMSAPTSADTVSIT